jgi:hypothetical protein
MKMASVTLPAILIRATGKIRQYDKVAVLPGFPGLLPPLLENGK